VGETVFVTPKMGRELCDTDRRELDMIFSFEHMETDQHMVKWFKRQFHPGRFASVISKWQKALCWPANYLENHDQPRSVSRFGDDGEYWDKSAKLLATLLLTLRGTPYIYQGEEIGMTNFDFTGMDQLQDVESHNVYRLMKKLGFPKGLRWKLIRLTSRDNARTPMQWDDTENAGFTTGEPWLGINHNYTRINMSAQENDPGSIRGYYKKLIALRAGHDVLRHGDFTPLVIEKRLFEFRRTLDGESVIVLLNFSRNHHRVHYAGEVLLSNYEDFDGVLKPYQSVILKEPLNKS